MTGIRMQTSLDAPEQLPDEVAEWKEKIDTYTLEGAEVPDDFLSKIPATIKVTTKLGDKPITVEVPNPLYEQYPYSRLFAKETEVPTYEEISPLEEHPWGAAFWTLRKAPEKEEEVYEVPTAPYEEVKPPTVKELRTNLEGKEDLLETFNTVLDWAVPAERDAEGEYIPEKDKPEERLRKLLDDIPEDTRMQTAWMQRAKKATGLPFEDIYRVFAPVFRQEAAAVVAPELVAEEAVGSMNRMLDDWAREDRAEIREFKQYLENQNLDPNALTESAYAQELISFRESRPGGATRASLDDLEQTLGYLTNTIDQMLAREGREPEAEYFSAVPKQTAKTRADAINLMNKLLDFEEQEPERVSRYMDEASVLLKTLDELDSGVEQFVSSQEEKGRAATEEAMLEGYKDDFIRLYHERDSIPRLQEYVDEYNSEINENASEIKDALKKYKSYGKELAPYEERFTAYRKEQGVKEGASDYDIAKARFDFVQSLPAEEQAKFESLAANVYNLERGELLPLIRVQRISDQIEELESEYSEVTEKLQDAGVDPMTLIREKAPKPKQGFEEFLTARDVDLDTLSQDQLSALREDFYNKVRQDVAKAYKERWKKNTKQRLPDATLQEFITSQLAASPYIGRYLLRNVSTPYEFAVVDAAFAPLVKAKQVQNAAIRAQRAKTRRTV